MPGLPAVTGRLAAGIGRQRRIAANFFRQQLTKLFSGAVFRRRRQIADSHMLVERQDGARFLAAAKSCERDSFVEYSGR